MDESSALIPRAGPRLAAHYTGARAAQDPSAIAALDPLQNNEPRPRDMDPLQSFEVSKRVAEFYLEEYLRNLRTWRGQTGGHRAAVAWHPDQETTAVVVRTSPASEPVSVKAARDSLVKHFYDMEQWLGFIKERDFWNPSLLIGSVFFFGSMHYLTSVRPAIPDNLLGLANVSAVLVCGLSASFSGYIMTRTGAILLCEQSVGRLLNAARDGSLDEEHEKELESKRFRLLEWMG